MLHHPWGQGEAPFSMPGSVIKNIFTAYLMEGGSENMLCDIINNHIPAENQAITASAIVEGNLYFSLEFYFYLITFSKLLLDNPYFRYQIDENTQLPEYHRILEQGPIRSKPWIPGTNGPETGYLSISNIRCMFAYIEEAVPVPPFAGNTSEYDTRMCLSREALEYINKCTPTEFHVDRSFFDKEEIFISFEYLYYSCSIMEMLSNDMNFPENSLYYGYLNNIQLSRAIFHQPSVSPAERFHSWYNKTNNTYDIEIRQKRKTLEARINYKKQLDTGMFGLYQARCITGIKQAVPAAYRAFLELYTLQPVKIKIIEHPDDPYSFSIKMRYITSGRSGIRFISVSAPGILALAILFSVPEIIPQKWHSAALFIASLSLMTLLSCALASGRHRFKFMEKKFRETRKIIDDQYTKLRLYAEELLHEKGVLEQKVKNRTSELEKALAKIESLDRAKTNFIANVSHELRTPLTLLSVPLEEIRRGRYGDNLSKNHNIFSMIERNVERLNVQISQLLDYARLDLGTMPFSPEKLLLAAYCKRVIAELQSLAERKNLSLVFENLTEHDEIVIDADHDLFETVMLNLLNNALKFTENGTITVMIEKLPKDNFISLVVKDTGIGFSEKEKERLFLRFTRAGEHSPRGYEGTGLGLALVREIAAKHCWTVDAKSSPGNGSSFFLVIPVSSFESSGTEKKASGLAELRIQQARSGLFYQGEKTHICQKAGEKEIILIVEDNPDMGAVLKDLLEEFYCICWRKSAAEAFDYLESGEHVSLIICDIMMPGMSGLDFREKLAGTGKWKDIPFIFLTALADPEIKIHGLEIGALDYIQKPFSGSELLFKVRNILSARKNSYLQALDDSKAVERLSSVTAFADFGSRKRNISMEHLKEDDIARIGITPAEKRVIALLVQGLQDKEIADRISVSPRTVSSHLGKLYQKTGTGNRVELLSRLFRNNQDN